MTREERLAAAGNYVLGQLEGAELAAFEAALTADAELAGMVARLQAQLQALDDTVEPATVDAAMWAKIEARLGAQVSATPAVPTATRPAPRRSSPAWYTALAASVVVAAGLGFAAGSLMRPEAKPVVIAVLVDEAGTLPGAIVEAFADNSVRIVPQPQPGQLYEITLEPAPGSPTGRPTGPILAKGLARVPL